MLLQTLYLTALSTVAIAQTLTPNLIYQFPLSNFAALEGIAVRNNGKLVLTTSSGPTIYGLDPAAPNPQLFATLPGTGATGGITEVSPDVFLVGSGNFSVANGLPSGITGTMEVWTLNLNGAPSVKLLTKIPEANFLNGATTIPGCQNVLFTDSGLGALWQINPHTGAYKLVIKDPLFQPTPYVTLGVNGIHFKGEYLYFTNSALGIYGRIKYTFQGEYIAAVGVAEKVAGGPTPDTSAFDDFSFDKSGTAFIATHVNSIVAVTDAGVASVVIGGGNSTLLNNPTSTAFDKSGCNFYIITEGSFQPPVGGGVYTVNTCGTWKPWTA